jgi:hypothetical protein
MTLLVRDGGAAGAGEVENFVPFESCFFAPAPEIGAAKVKGVAKFDQHVERHQEAKGVFAPLVIDDILHGDERAVLRQRVVGRLDQLFLFLEIPVVQNHSHGNHIRFWQRSLKKSPAAV